MSVYAVQVGQLCVTNMVFNLTDLVLRRATSPSDPAFWGKTHRKTQI